MNDDKKNEIQNQISEQKSEKRKKKKRRGKASQSSENITSNPQEEKPLVTISSIITDENSKLPINDTNINNQEKSTEQNPTKLRKRKKEKNEDINEEQKEKSDILPKAKTMASVNEQITYVPEDLSLDKENDINERTKSEVIVRDKKGSFLKRANNVDNEEGTKKVMEKSWFNRGNMIMVQGIRLGDTFVAKKYASSVGHQLYHILDIKEDGSLILQDKRYKGDGED
jgi:hypothetical protein